MVKRLNSDHEDPDVIPWPIQPLGPNSENQRDLVAWIMDEGRKIQEEQALTV